MARGSEHARGSGDARGTTTGWWPMNWGAGRCAMGDERKPIRATSASQGRAGRSLGVSCAPWNLGPSAELAEGRAPARLAGTTTWSGGRASVSSERRTAGDRKYVRCGEVAG
jgi:hypothetical protein